MGQSWLDRLSPQIHVIGSGSMTPPWVEPPRRLYEHQLAVFTEGECLIQMEGESFACRKGTYLIIPPNRLHSASTPPGQGFSTYSIHFDWVCSAQPFAEGHCVYHPQQIPASAVHPAPSFIPAKLLRGKIELMEDVADLLAKLSFRWRSRNPSYRASCRALLLEVLLLILSPGTGGQGQTGRKADHLAQEARRLLQESFLKPLSIQKTLESLGYSYPHLCQLFRKSYGTTPLEYLNGLRLEHAKKLMLTPACTIKEAALGSGFNDPHYFSRVFRRRNGTPPRDFILKMNSPDAKTAGD